MRNFFYIILTLTILGFGCAADSDTMQPSFDESIAMNSYDVEIDGGLEDVNFSEVGNITDWDEKTDSYVEEWLLTYEKPGSASISVKLYFDDDSICVVANEEYPCEEILTREFNGKRLSVQGISNGDIIHVKRITF